MFQKQNLKLDFKEAYNKMFTRITLSLLNTLLNILLSILLFANDIIGKDTPYFWGITITIVTMLIVAIISVFYEHKKEDAYIYSEFLQKDIENKELQKDRSDLLNLVFETREFMSFVFNFFVFSKKLESREIFASRNIQKTKQILDEYLKGYLFHKLRFIFGICKNEHFSLAIYLYDKKSKILWDFLSKKDPIINKHEDSGRDWKTSECSHIAFCFNHQIEIMHSDIPKRFKEFGLPNTNSKDKDIENYKSAITLPIFFRQNNKKTIVGVFCLTSDNIGTFHELTDEITDPVYSLKIFLLRFLVETISEILSLLYNNNENEISKPKTSDSKI